MDFYRWSPRQPSILHHTICIGGKWECTGDAKCPSTCIINGEGHVTTFDGNQYVFDGSCEYTLVQDACSVDSRQPSFKIVSENIICGKTGVVCTKSIKIYFQDSLIKLTNGHYQITPPNTARGLKVISNPLYLKFDLKISSMLELTIIWNRNMNAYISITRLSEVYRMPYYDNCVRDACGCELAGDCECLCDAVAVYAKACIDAGVCIDWRTPDFCPVYCDYFNYHKGYSIVGESSWNTTNRWHYQPCLCPANIHIFGKFNMEGCYICGKYEYFHEELRHCVPCGKFKCYFTFLG
ncbi:hypothetical protein chiPu_0020468 [Chiloscyllium punctatum]|uniref:VWFD domain-containing protein n=1 Tax=Chiloscyllium punctatum TaxID=137246 RepID=A0A401RG01_CHIPU|nr:hypothetical protein [Chiloscyllium punctatum]